MRDRASRAGKRRPYRSAALALMPMYAFTLAFVFGPLVYMLALSVMHRGGGASGSWGVTPGFTPRAYLRIFEPVYLSIFAHSLRLALLSTALVTVIGYPFGYFMARLDKKWRGRVMFLLIVPFWTSSLMRLYGWIIILRAGGVIETALGRMGMLSESLRLLYTYPAVVAGMVYVLVPFMIYAVFSSAEKLDRAHVEAARDLGASAPRAFLTISFRLTMPGVLSGVILTFIPSMGLYFIADILGGNKVVLVGSLIQEQLMKAHDWPFAAALSVALTVLTSALLYAYRRLTKSDKLEGIV
ncbi:MAG: ABC transporter permease [Oscillospiraceae bacterium]|nr:ABC transporter permease [Oscillospiraceae bacterium]